MFDNVQTSSVGVDMLTVGPAPLMHWVWKVIAKRAMNMDRVVTRRALVKGGLIAGALIPVAGLLIIAGDQAAVRREPVQ